MTGDYGSIHSVNPLYFTIGGVDGYIEEKNGNKYLIFGSTELWNGIKSHAEKISENPGNYDEKYIKIKLIQMTICL